jgi:prophage tail gpP-like protein
MRNEASIVIDTTEYTGWTEWSVSRTLKALCGTFTFTMVDGWTLNNQRIGIQPDQRVQIYINDNLIMSGYVNTVAAALGKNSHSINITGRSNTADLVDCSAMNNPGTWQNRTMQQIITDICKPFGISVVDNTNDTTKFTTFKLNSGEKALEACMRAAAKRSAIIISDQQGNIVITNADTAYTADGLQEGVNLLTANVVYNYKNRFKNYYVRGQQYTTGEGWTRETITINGEAEDSGITRYRPIILKSDGATTNKDAQQRARWEAGVRQARSIGVTCKVQGFTQSNGELWPLNKLTNVNAPSLLVDTALLIEDITYAQTATAGSVTTMGLVPNGTYAAEPPKKTKQPKNLGW